MKKLMLAALIGAAAAIALTGCKKEAAQTEEIVWSTTGKAGTEETVPTDKEEPETPEKAGDGDTLPPDSARSDGNLFGNMYCYARMNTDGETVYFRNPQANEQVYRTDPEAFQEPEKFCDEYMKDMQYLDGYIYYCATPEGDQGKAAADKNLYRIKTDGTGKQKLTDRAFDQDNEWMSFDTIVDGVCYYTYGGPDGVFHVGTVGTDGSGEKDLFTIAPEDAAGLRHPNVVDSRLYYVTKEGLRCFLTEDQTDQLVIPGFATNEMIIYGGQVYYYLGADQNSAQVELRRVGLDGTQDTLLYSGNEYLPWAGYLQFSIYKNRIYFLALPQHPEQRTTGSLFVMNLDGSEAYCLIDQATWFNIFDDVIYYRFYEEGNAASQAEAPVYKVKIPENDGTAYKKAVQGQLLCPRTYASAAGEYPFGQEKNANETETVVNWVRSCWTMDRNAIEKGTYDKKVLDSSVTVYSSDGEVVMIEAAAGYGGNSFSRTYEYRDGKLIFAFYTAEGQEYRMYYDGDSLFRLRIKLNGNETVLDGAYGDQEYRQWHQDGLSQGYQLYRLAAGETAPSSVARPGNQSAAQTDFVFKTIYSNALGNGEEYITSIFGTPDDTYEGTQGEVADQNMYSYEEPWLSFTLQRSRNLVFEMYGNTETLFELSKDSYTVEEVSAFLGARQNTGVYEGEDVEGAFAFAGETAFYCENEYYSFEFILQDGKVAGDSRSRVSFSPYLCLY